MIGSTLGVSGGYQWWKETEDGRGSGWRRVVVPQGSSSSQT